MKALPTLFFLMTALFICVLVFAPAPAEGQVYLPHTGRIMLSPTPTVEVTVAISPTGTIIPTRTPRNTSTVSPTPSISPAPSNTPTITETPTQTETPATTPTITPTPTDTIGDGVIVLNTHHNYLGSDGRVTVVGEVRNDTKSNATNIRVRVTLYNNRTDVVDALDLYLWLDILKPTEKSCFEAVFLGHPVYNRYGFETMYSSTSAAPRTLSIVDHGTLYVQDQGAWNVFGQVRNHSEATEGEGAQPLVYPQIIGTLYAAEGHVIDCMYVNSLADTLAPGETSIWEMTFRPMPVESATTYRVQAK